MSYDRRKFLRDGLTFSFCGALSTMLSDTYLVSSNFLLPDFKPLININSADADFLNFLREFEPFVKMERLLITNEICFEITCSLKIDKLTPHSSRAEMSSFTLFEMNKSYGRFSNFTDLDQEFFVVTRGPAGKKLKTATDLNILAKPIENITSRNFFTDALPHAYNLKYLNKILSLKEHYWIDTISRQPITFYLNSNNFISPKLKNRLKDLGNDLTRNIYELEQSSLQKIASCLEVKDFNQLVHRYKNI